MAAPAVNRKRVTIVAREGDGWLEERDGRLVLHTRGTPYQEGWQHGVLMRRQVRECFREVWREGWFQGSPLLPGWLWRAYARLNSAHFTPDERAELRGLAAGARLDYADVLVMNSQSPIDVIHSWLTPGDYGACTQLIAAGPATRGGGMLVARNLDTIGFGRLHRYAMVQVHHPRAGHEFVTPGFAGKVLDAVSGWNARGLHVCQDDAEAAGQNPFGLYSGALVRRLAQHCASIDEAIAAVRRLPRLAAGAKHVTLADGREARLVEIRQDLRQGLRGFKDVAVRGLGDDGDPAGTAVITNHFTTPGMTSAAPSASSRWRHERARRLVAAGHGSLDAEAAMRILTDKLDLESGGVCGRQRPSNQIVNWYGPRITRFGPFEVPTHLEVRIATTLATVSDLAAGVMWIAGGRSYVEALEHFQPLLVGALWVG